MSGIDENEIRKQIWARKRAIDAKMAESGFDALPVGEQDAWVLSLMLDLPFDVASRCVRGESQVGERALLWEEIDEVFKYGQRSTLQPLKDVLARHETLKRPAAGSAEAFGEGGYEVIPPEDEA